VNVYAGDANQEYILEQSFRLFGHDVVVRLRAYEWTWENGMNNVRGALNIELSQTTTGKSVNHYTIRDGSVPETYQLMEFYISESLQ
ncbi:MAG TPA: hypothetical protein P5121_31425, partial [Caldilineaceae bacterium]|nr:hypothetical protein [Caldilineaceae bacterium]